MKKANILIEGIEEDNIESLMSKYEDILNIKEELEEYIESIKNNITKYLKERKWNNYKDKKTKISVSLMTQKKETINKETLKLLLNEEQYNQIIITKAFEKLLILTKKDQDRIKKQFN